MVTPVIIQEPTSIQPIDIKKAEEKYNATFVGDFCLRAKGGGWVNSPAAVFWQEDLPQPEYSHYFALVYENGVLYITSGRSAFTEPIVGIVADDGEVIYSRYRHDYRTSSDGSVFIDGGRDYVRCPPNKTLVHIIPDGPKLIVVPIPQKGEENGTN